MIVNLREDHYCSFRKKYLFQCKVHNIISRLTEYSTIQFLNVLVLKDGQQFKENCFNISLIGSVAKCGLYFEVNIPGFGAATPGAFPFAF